MTRNVSLIFILFFASLCSYAQEFVLPLPENINLAQASTLKVNAKKRQISLPFFEDFSEYDLSPYPNPNRWLDNKVYVNNTLGNNPVAKGVATFDGFDQKGYPYYPTNNILKFKADSLSSQYFDFNTYAPSDSIYLSFYYQSTGNGFSPESGDSLMLYFRNNNNNWIKVWSVNGGPSSAFIQQNIAVKETQYLHDSFQFRFVNIVSPNSNDDNWNVDFIRMDKNRNFLDTASVELSFTGQPTFMLSPYTAMPYRQYVNYKSDYTAANFTAFLNNTNFTDYTLNLNLQSRELISNTPLFATTAPVFCPALGGSSWLLNSYTHSFAPANPNSKVIIEHQYYINNNPNADHKNNDTIVRRHVFDNYLAYDDGSAEKSYTLLPAFGLSAKTALKFNIKEADSVAGLMIRFGNQTPWQQGKPFNIKLYKNLGGITQADDVLYSQNYYSVNYADTVDGYTYYAFDKPVYVDSGTYYIGTEQAPFLGIDTLYFGLDVNTNANYNYLYYNVDGTWYSSTLQGSIMIRPILGTAVKGTAIAETQLNNNVEVYPNPALTNLYLKSTKHLLNGTYNICNVFGQIIQTNAINAIGTEPLAINIAGLPGGIYFLHCKLKDQTTFTHKFIKE